MTSAPLKVAANRERQRFELDVVARRDLKEVERGSGAPAMTHYPLGRLMSPLRHTTHV